MTKTYKAKRTKGFIFLMICMLLMPILLYFAGTEMISKNPWGMLPLLSPLVLIVWLYIDTGYKVVEDKLYYRSAFLRGNIPIDKIQKITKGKTLWSGTKPALAGKGLIIVYNKYDEIYIAPVSNDELIADLLSINPAIQIISP